MNNLIKNCFSTIITAMIWISETAFKLTDGYWIGTFLLIICCMIMKYKVTEERGISALLECVFGGIFCICVASYKFWNKTTLPEDEIKAVNNQNETKEIDENPPPVIVENSKKKQKKGKRSSKKNYYNKENKEPTVTKKETKMHPELDICEKLNRDTKSIYDYLHQYILTDTQLKMNHFPHEGYHPWTQVEAGDSKRVCARCGENFEILQGCLLAGSKCYYHPRKATFAPGSSVRVHGCCSGPFGSAPCAVSNCHVTVQHSPRPLTKTPSRRHVRRDLQHSIFSLDCEMCYTTDGLEVVRVGLVNLEGLAVYDGYVKPRSKILDYNTMYSGVDKSHLQNVTVSLEDVKKILNGFIQEDTILVGHALNNDLSVLGLIHGTIVDTSVLYADPRNPLKKTALKKLASDYLGLKIQDGQSGHDCIDDARASLQLALLKVPPAEEQPLPEQQQPTAEQQQIATATDLVWAQQQLPLAEIQNFHSQYQTSGYEYCDRPSHYYPHNHLWSYQQPIPSYAPLKRRY